MRTLPLLLPLLVPALPASPLPARSEGAQEVDEARFERMLLHLADGRVLRVRARAVEGGFEVQGGRDATYRVPAEAVTRAADEAEVLREARRLAEQVERGDPVRRVALASWMFDQGLWDEGIDELDPVLGADPDQPDAIALLASSTPPLALPALDPGEDPERAVRAFLGAVAGAKPVAREVAILRLAELAETGAPERAAEDRTAAAPAFDLQALLRDELGSSSVRRRALAARALRRIFPGEAAQPLLARAVLDGSADVREEAARALRAAEEPALCIPVIRALGSSSSAVRTNAAEALGHMGYPHAVAPLVGHLAAVDALAQSGGGYHPPASHIFVGKQVSYVQDYDVEVAQASAIADPVIQTLTEGAVLDVRVLAVSQTQIVSEKAAVRRALGGLTGAKPGSTTKAWLDWWAEHEAAWLARMEAPAGPATPGG